MKSEKMNDQADEFQSLRDFYDNEYYGGQTASHGQLPWHCRRVGDRLQLPDSAEVLDVACGTGEWLSFFRERGASISGIDLSSTAINQCKQRLPQGEFHCGPAESLPFEDGRFDLVTCMGSLEHFLDKPRALRAMHRVAKPGATVVILVPNAGFLTRRLGLYGGTNQVKVREDVYELEHWQGLFEAAGFKVVERWRDLHALSWYWIRQGSVLGWPVRALQALALAVWPLRWQYQVYFRCTKEA